MPISAGLIIAETTGIMFIGYLFGYSIGVLDVKNNNKWLCFIFIVYLLIVSSMTYAILREHRIKYQEIRNYYRIPTHNYEYRSEE